MSDAQPADNCLTIAGLVAGPCETRTSPAGIAITRFSLEHRSAQMEAGIPREVTCRVPIMACGQPLAETTRRLSPGTRVRVRGFVGRANHRAGTDRLVLHADCIDIVDTERPTLSS